MIDDRQRDRLVHVLLLEELAKQAPPDVTEAVLGKALAGRTRRIWLWPAVAAAAILLLAGGAWFALLARRGPVEYPAPQAQGDYRVLDGGAVRRGAILVSGQAAAQVELGGYCRLTLVPGSQLKLEGDNGAEQVYLQSGSAVCEVDRNQGTFAVRTDVGTVWVTGTQFTVSLVQPEGDKTAAGLRMAVKVLRGSVQLRGSWGATTLVAGEERTVGPGAARAATGVAAAGRPVPTPETQSVHQGQAGGEMPLQASAAPAASGAPMAGEPNAPAAAAEIASAAIKPVESPKPEPQPGAQKPIEKTPQTASAPAATGEKATTGPVATGTVTGIVTAKGDNSLTVKAEGEKDGKTYFPHKRPAAGGGLDKDMLEKIHKIAIGSKVRIVWAMEEHLCIDSIEVLEPLKSAATKVAPKTLTGKLVRMDGPTKVLVKVAGQEQPVAVVIDEKTAITLDGKPARLVNLQKDMEVVITPATGTAAVIAAVTTTKERK